MLLELSIQNLALIEQLRLNFHQGFSCLTGETGAGKSILLDALGLSLGERSDTSLVRHGKSRADVTATFDLSSLPHIENWLQQNELETEEKHCLLRRTVNAKGGSKAYINSIPVPATLLKELGNQLIDIHGQHEHQSLVHAKKQPELLDAFANHPKLVSKTRKTFQEWHQALKDLQALQNQQAERQHRLELLQFQSKEFADLSPAADEYETLSEQQQTLSHANEIQNACYQASQLLDAEGSTSDQLQMAIHALENVVAVRPKLQPTLEQLNSSLIDIQEAASELENQANQVELDPQELERVDVRLSEFFSLAKKYQIEPNSLHLKWQEIEQSIDEITNPKTSMASLEQRVEENEKNYQKAAEALSKSRKASAKKLAKTITQGMQELGMPNGEFQIHLTPKSQASAEGVDKVEFLVSANKGLPLQALSKVASGGELSRISLAIQVATAEVTQLPTLIFDEVDVGIGGAVAEMVGKKLQTLGKHKQILSITHLPQVASHGHQHLQIQKYTENDLTFTQVSNLQTQQRVEEIARMLGGMKVTQNTLQHASEMLEQAHL